VSKDWFDALEVLTVTPIYAGAFHVTPLVVFTFQYSPQWPKTWWLCSTKAYY
jgi:hypothetical protein